MADYRAKHPEIIVYFVLFAICIILNICIYYEFLEFSNHHRRRKFKWYVNFCLFYVGAFFFFMQKLTKFLIIFFISLVNADISRILGFIGIFFGRYLA